MRKRQIQVNCVCVCVCKWGGFVWTFGFWMCRVRFKFEKWYILNSKWFTHTFYLNYILFLIKLHILSAIEWTCIDVSTGGGREGGRGQRYLHYHATDDHTSRNEAELIGNLIYKCSTWLGCTVTEKLWRKGSFRKDKTHSNHGKVNKEFQNVRLLVHTPVQLVSVTHQVIVCNPPKNIAEEEEQGRRKKSLGSSLSLMSRLVWFQ